jgi:hypothetical protein
LLPPTEAPACAWAQPALLDAGTLLITAPGIFSQAVPRSTDGKYEVGLSPATIGLGRFSVTSTGGADVGSFTTEIHAPDPITVTSMFSPDTQFGELVTVAWSGGSPNSLVEVAIDSNLLGVRSKSWAVVPAAAGNVVFGSAGVGLPLPRGSSLEIVVRQVAAEPSSFQAAGLTLGGRHTVVYEVHFVGLRL